MPVYAKAQLPKFYELLKDAQDPKLSVLIRVADGRNLVAKHLKDAVEQHVCGMRLPSHADKEAIVQETVLSVFNSLFRLDEGRSERERMRWARLRILGALKDAQRSHDYLSRTGRQAVHCAEAARDEIESRAAAEGRTLTVAEKDAAIRQAIGNVRSDTMRLATSEHVTVEVIDNLTHTAEQEEEGPDAETIRRHTYRRIRVALAMAALDHPYCDVCATAIRQFLEDNASGGLERLRNHHHLLCALIRETAV